MLNKLTQEQLKEFWEWCGAKYTDPEPCPTCHRPEAPYWIIDSFYYAELTGLLDLNNLFKYAVPKAISVLATLPISCPSIIKIYRFLFERWAGKLIDEPDPTLALFWAIWEVIHAK